MPSRCNTPQHAQNITNHLYGSPPYLSVDAADVLDSALPRVSAPVSAAMVSAMPAARHRSRSSVHDAWADTGAVDQRAAAGTGVGEKDAHLAILGPARRSRVLALNSGRADTLPQKTGIVHDQHRTRVTKMLEDVFTDVGQDLVGT